MKTRGILWTFLFLGAALLPLACSTNSSPTNPTNNNQPPANTPTFSPTTAATGTNSQTFTPSPTPTASPTLTPTNTPNNTGTVSNSSTPTNSATHSPTETPTPTPSPTGTIPTNTPTPIPTDTPACSFPSQFGYQSIGATPLAIGYIYAEKAVVQDANPVTLTSLTAYFTQIGGRVRAGVYADNGSGTSPTTLITESNELFPSGTGWTQLDLHDAVLSSPATYWLALQTTSDYSLTYVTLDGGAPPNSWAYSLQSGYSFGPFPSTFPLYLTYPANLSIYGNYCHQNPPGTPTFTFTYTPTRTYTPTATITFTPIQTDTPACPYTTSFGVLSAGVTSYTGLPYVFAQKAILTAPIPVTVTSLSAYFIQIGGPVRAAVYSDNGSGTSPQNLLTESNELFPSGTGWIDLDLHDYVLSSPATYWLALQTPWNGGTPTILARDPSGPTNSWSYGDGTSYTYGPFPSVYTIYRTYSDLLSIKANYCNPPGSPTITPTETLTPTATFTPTSTFTTFPTDTPDCPFTSSFGELSAGVSTYTGLPYVFAQKAVLSTPGFAKVTSLSAYFTQIGGPVRAAVYSDNGSGTSPQNLLTESNELLPSGTGWIDLDIHDYVLSGPATYWLALQTPWGNGGGTPSIIAKDPTGPANSWAYGDGASYTYGPFPSVYTIYRTYSDLLSIKANYCLVTVTDTPTPTSTFTSSSTPTPTLTKTNTPTSTMTFTATLSPTLTPCSTQMPYGDTIIGSAGGPAANIIASSFSLPSSARMLSISLYSSAVTQAKVGLYADNGAGTAPSTLIVESGSQNVTVGWNQLDVTDTQLSGPATYWLAFHSADNNYTIRALTNHPYALQAHGFATPFPSSGSFSPGTGQSFSIYANTCP